MAFNKAAENFTGTKALATARTKKRATMTLMVSLYLVDNNLFSLMQLVSPREVRSGCRTIVRTVDCISYHAYGASLSSVFVDHFPHNIECISIILLIGRTFYAQNGLRICHLE
jgi:hypothetical protein